MKFTSTRWQDWRDVKTTADQLGKQGLAEESEEKMLKALKLLRLIEHYLMAGLERVPTYQVQFIITGDKELMNKLGEESLSIKVAANVADLLNGTGVSKDTCALIMDRLTDALAKEDASTLEELLFETDSILEVIYPATEVKGEVQ